MKKKTGMDWLRDRMDALGYGSLRDVAAEMDINVGNLWRYFHHINKPSVALLPVMCQVLKASPLEVLSALGVRVPKGVA